MTALLLASVLLLQQGPAAPRQTDSAEVNASRETISAIGLAVAEVRSGSDVLRRAAFNDPDAVVVERARLLQLRCEELTTAARAAPARICRTCFGRAQPAIERYRASLAGAVQTGTRCTNTLRAQLRERQSAAAVKRGIRPFGQLIIAGLRPYEDAIHGVRVALGLEVPIQQAAPPRRRPG